MPQVRIHNITDRPNVGTPAYAVKVAGQRVRPGKSIVVDEGLLSPKFRNLHGNDIWIGDQVPAKYKATSRAALRALTENTPPMTDDEAREYLASLPKEDLLTLCNQMSPALSFAKEPSSRMLVVKIARSAFSANRVLSPEHFFWLRRWTKQGNAFVERG